MRWLRRYRHHIRYFLLQLTCCVAILYIYGLLKGHFSSGASDRLSPVVSTNYLSVLIISAPTAEAGRRRQAIRETWLRLHEHAVFYRFVIGTKNLDAQTIELLRLEKDVLLLETLEDKYENLSQKVASMFVWLAKNVEFEFALKVDDDSFVRLDELCHQLTDMTHASKTRLYWGYFDGRATVKQSGKWLEKDWVLCDRYLPHARGGGYILAKELVKFVAANYQLLKFYRSEDISVGAWLAGMEVYYRHDVRFDTEFRSRGCQNSYLITHKQSIEDMQQKYRQLTTAGSLCQTETQQIPPYDYNWSVPPSQCCVRVVT